jgi:hypothetical protein
MYDFLNYIKTLTSGKIPETEGNKLNILEEMWWEKEKKSISLDVSRYVNQDPDAHPMPIKEKTVGDHLKEGLYSIGITLLEKRLR